MKIKESVSRSFYCSVHCFFLFSPRQLIQKLFCDNRFIGTSFVADPFFVR